MEKHDKTMFAVGTVLLLLTAALQVAARQSGEFATWYAHHVYPVLVGVIGRISGIVPFSVVELGLYVLAVGGVIYAAVHIRKPWRLCAGTVLLCGGLLFSYTVNCGINYHAMSFSAYVGIETGLYSTEELRQLCEYLLEQVNETAEDGADLHYKDDRAGWKAEGVSAMRRAGSQFACLGGYYPQPKEVAVSHLPQVAGVLEVIHDLLTV